MRILSIILALALISPVVLAQKTSKEEKKLKKEWKKKMKKMDPLEFKEIVESSERSKRELTSLRNENVELQNEVNAKSDELKKAVTAIKKCRGQLAEAKSAPKKVDSPFAVGDPGVGILFKVQIGAFRNKDLSKFLDNHPNFSGEEEDGMRKYTLGMFREYYEADEFKAYLIAMGVKDAWIVSYKDGNRVDIKEVLQG
jgi:uncharacterized protein YoxC